MVISSCVRPRLTLAIVSSAMLLVGNANCQRTPTIERDGGVRLVFAIAQQRGEEFDADAQDKTDDFPDLPTAMQRRLYDFPGAIVKPLDDEQFEFTIPNVTRDDLPYLKLLIGGRGILRFQIIANERDHGELIAKARESDEEFIEIDGEKAGWWVKVGMEQRPDGTFEYSGISLYDVLRGRRDGDTFEVVELPRASLEAVNRELSTMASVITESGYRDLEVLVVLEPKGLNISGKHLQRATKSYDDTLNPCVSFTMKPGGAKLLERITADNSPDHANELYRRLGIILDEELIAAPRLLGVIRDHGQITGNFTEADVDYIVGALRAGRLPLVLQREPVSETWIKPESRD